MAVMGCPGHRLSNVQCYIVVVTVDCSHKFYYFVILLLLCFTFFLSCICRTCTIFPCPVYRTSNIALSCIQDMYISKGTAKTEWTLELYMYCIPLSCIQDKQYLAVLVSCKFIHDMYNIPLSCIQYKQYIQNLKQYLPVMYTGRAISPYPVWVYTGQAILSCPQERKDSRRSRAR